MLFYFCYRHCMRYKDKIYQICRSIRDIFQIITVMSLLHFNTLAKLGVFRALSSTYPDIYNFVNIIVFIPTLNQSETANIKVEYICLRAKIVRNYSSYCTLNSDNRFLSIFSSVFTFNQFNKNKFPPKRFQANTRGLYIIMMVNEKYTMYCYRWKYQLVFEWELNLGNLNNASRLWFAVNHLRCVEVIM